MTRSAKDLFNSAIALPAQQRSAYLDRECGDDRELRERVESDDTSRAFFAEAEELMNPPAATQPSTTGPATRDGKGKND